MKIEKICEVCSIKFERQNWEKNVRFCSNLCRTNGLTKQRLIVICKICSHEFKIRESEKRNRKAIYCSRSCSNIGVGGDRVSRTSKECERCFKIFTYLECTRNNAQYCSLNCRNQDNIKSKSQRELRFITKFEESYIKNNDNECWPWISCKNTKGYGILRHINKNILAHRASWLIHRKIEITKGKFVLHICDNPPCVNPSHLYLGTMAENSKDMVLRGRHKRVSKLTESQVIEIKKNYLHKFTDTDISQQFKVSRKTVNNIRNGKIWKSVQV